jgi:RHH-type rel operon transcriptional repressor/antitoxin RelB
LLFPVKLLPKIDERIENTGLLFIFPFLLHYWILFVCKNVLKILIYFYKMLYLYSKVNNGESDTMLAIRLPEKMEQRLDSLARKTGRTKTYYAREAILTYIEDLEDIYLSLERLEKPAKRWSLEELEKGVDLES